MMMHCHVFLQSVFVMCPAFLITPADPIPLPSAALGSAVPAAFLPFSPPAFFSQPEWWNVDDLRSSMNTQEIVTS